jgi:hypothetical protein
MTVEAAAVDNVGIRLVSFSVDGSPAAAGEALVTDRPPYKFTLDLTPFARGWHFVGARAYDIAGNISDTPLVPVLIGFSEDLQDTLVNLKFHNNFQDTSWSLPDSRESFALWTRFNPARNCQLRAVYLNCGLTLDSSSVDSSSVEVSVWRGTGAPDTTVSSVTLAADELDSNLVERRIPVVPVSLRGQNDFFLVVIFRPRKEGDVLRLAADSGQPPWGRSGSRDADGWHSLSERFSSPRNLIMACDLYYDVLRDTTLRR